MRLTDSRRADIGDNLEKENTGYYYISAFTSKSAVFIIILDYIF